MAKKDRYNLGGADDSLDSESDSSSPSTEDEDANEATTRATPTVERNPPETSSIAGEKPEIGEDKSAETTTSQEPPSSAAETFEVPHRVRYDSPKDGRKAKTLYLDAEHDLTRLRELHSVAEAEFDEKVHRLDVYLAAFRSDLSDESFLAEMRHIGYGYFDQ
jgi:hypothetical protein